VWASFRPSVGHRKPYGAPFGVIGFFCPTARARAHASSHTLAGNSCPTRSVRLPGQSQTRHPVRPLRGCCARPRAPGRRTLRVCTRGRDGLRPACIVPHTVPAPSRCSSLHLRCGAGVGMSFREAHVGRCPAAFPGSRSIPEAKRRGLQRVVRQRPCHHCWRSSCSTRSATYTFSSDW
jgi:hypothetical protein